MTNFQTMAKIKLLWKNFKMRLKISLLFKLKNISALQDRVLNQNFYAYSESSYSSDDSSDPSVSCDASKGKTKK